MNNDIKSIISNSLFDDSEEDFSIVLPDGTKVDKDGEDFWISKVTLNSSDDTNNTKENQPSE